MTLCLSLYLYWCLSITYGIYIHYRAGVFSRPRGGSFHIVCIVHIASVRPNLVPCFNLVLPSLEPPAHTFRALESCWHAGDGLPCCPVTSCGWSAAANGRADEEYQVRARYQVRANLLLHHRAGSFSPSREWSRGVSVRHVCDELEAELRGRKKRKAMLEGAHRRLGLTQYMYIKKKKKKK